jgi:hypothetical protein
LYPDLKRPTLRQAFLSAWGDDKATGAIAVSNAALMTCVLRSAARPGLGTLIPTNQDTRDSTVPRIGTNG